MYWQHEYEREGASMAVGTTYQLDLPENGMLGSLFLRLSADELSGYGQGVEDWRLLDKISKIIILGNGATILKSLTGRQLQAMTFWDQGCFPPSVWRNYASNTQFEYFLLNFGRYYGDTEYGLDLARFKNIEIQLTNTAASTDFGAIGVTIMGAYLQDAPAGQFKGFLRTEEWRSWTTVANETKYLDLPTEHVLRRIILQAIPDKTTTLEDTNFSNLMYDVECSLDTGQKRVYKGGVDDLARLNYWKNGHNILSHGLTYQTAGFGTEVDLGYLFGGAAVAATRDNAVATVFPSLNGGNNGGVIEFEGYEGDTMEMFLMAGLAPFYTTVIHFDLSDDPSTWLDPDRRKTVELNIMTRNSASAADGVNAVVLDRLVRY